MPLKDFETIQTGEVWSVTYDSSHGGEQTIEGEVVERDEPPAPCGTWVNLQPDGEEATIRVNLMGQTVSRQYSEEIANSRGTIESRELGRLLEMEHTIEEGGVVIIDYSTVDL